ncbi:MAG: Na(+)-translocating NADH-quinone reductase subunit C [Bdellovibrionales bacterium RIFOXYB1_FULL_37_110]|nr:MAG: Na(+)-translocating NADH-quinone reductase subunit C [Bdellovibrionales bacterium RIFOXYA1_FULL_38_20]OFZ49995.1 MAG: Na(+)-translocating NADH-quinone reductase subunit C [Bdellovibrionales bacterium RIFOXYC1_FULL_37_79]OFZ59901.1 MAG: Na(+)-translocating NADH-quinone reductase subunit C [Bdellovibrionales bacterium RIFOXYB1_FULL_37_110]OFZ63872.1 MAG: Na(+)-translocating NADH-quinone reductase subunit C [Bdellovibrionales bacterium RIFOXYD1_FULL_36_51]
MLNNSIQKTLLVSLLLCLVCSILVSVSVVMLNKQQEENKALDVKRNLLMATRLIDATATKDDIVEAYKKIEMRMIDLEKGDFTSDVDPQKYDLKKSRKDPKENIAIATSNDVANIKFRSKFSSVYFVKENGVTTQIVLPVYGKGLWSTMFGFLSLAPDLKTVKGFQFFEHGETPGLGGEVDNPNWQKIWPGKNVYDDQFHTKIDIVKGKVTNNPHKDFQVDGLSGATLTSNGVENLLHYWLGHDGFLKFLQNIKSRGDIK